MDKAMELLIGLYNIPSKSNHEQEITAAVKKLFLERGCKVKNKKGNLYITKGQSNTYPCIAAHLDEVHAKRGTYAAIYSPENDIIYGWSFSDNNFCGIGADDKNGIWVALQMVERLDYCKVALFRGEEIGCVGSQVAWMKFFEDCRFVLQVDRRNAGDLITDISGYMVSDEFMKDIQPIADKYGYAETHGLMTDVEELCNKGVGISCVNMSCGYYNPHSDKEFTVWSELNNTADFVEQICIRMTDVYTHVFEPMSYFPSTYDYWGNYYIPPYYKSDTKKDASSDVEESNVDTELLAADLYDGMMYDPHFIFNKEEMYTQHYADKMTMQEFSEAWDMAEDWVEVDINRYYNDEV